MPLRTSWEVTFDVPLVVSGKFAVFSVIVDADAAELVTDRARGWERTARVHPVERTHRRQPYTWLKVRRGSYKVCQPGSYMDPLHPPGRGWVLGKLLRLPNMRGPSWRGSMRGMPTVCRGDVLH